MWTPRVTVVAVLAFIYVAESSTFLPKSNTFLPKSNLKTELSTHSQHGRTKESLAQIVWEALTSFFEYFDKFLRMVLLPEGKSYVATVKSFISKNRLMADAVSNLYNHKDAFMKSGRLDKFLKDDRVWESLKQIRSLTGSMNSELYPALWLEETMKAKGVPNVVPTKPPTNIKNWFSADKSPSYFVKALKEILRRYIIVITAIKNFVAVNGDKFEKNLVAEFMKQYGSLTLDEAKELELKFDEIEDDWLYGRNPALSQWNSRVEYMSSNLDVAVRSLYSFILKFPDVHNKGAKSPGGSKP